MPTSTTRCKGQDTRTTSSPSGRIVLLELTSIRHVLRRVKPSQPSDAEVLTPAIPRNPTPRESGRDRPPLRTQDDSTQLETAEDTTTRRQDGLRARAHNYLNSPRGRSIDRELYNRSKYFYI